MVSSVEGRIAVDGGEVWYRRYGEGDSDATPLLLLHGGPGAASYYLEPFAERMARTRPVVVYDQLGCGRADQPDDPSLWTLDRFCAELDTVRSVLGLDRVHLMGQSWGGWLAIEYLIRGTTGISSVVLASTSAGLPQFAAEARRLIDLLPVADRDALIELGARGAYDDPAYERATHAFYERFLCRLDPWPDCLNRSAAALDGNQTYLTMNGPVEFEVIGTLRNWDRTADLHRITVPTLITCGRYDEITPVCAETLRAGIAGSRLEVFEHSAHVAHEEEPELYRAVVAAFLDDVEDGNGDAGR